MRSTVILVFMLIIFCYIAHEVASNGITWGNAIGLHVPYVSMYIMWLQIVCPPKTNNKELPVILFVTLMLSQYYIFFAMNKIGPWKI